MKCLVSTIPASLNPPLKRDGSGAASEAAPAKGMSSYSAYELARLKSLLRHHGHDVLALDLEPCTRNQVAAVLREFSPDVAIIDSTSFQDHPQRHAVLEYFLAVKTLSPATRTIWGGRDAAALASLALVHSLVVDVVLCDESDTTLPPLLARWQASGPRADLADFPGLAFRAGHDVHRTRRATPQELVSLDDLPFLDYGDIRLKAGDAPIVMSSRGCPYGCQFCYRQYRVRRSHSPGYFVGHLEHLHREFGFDKVKIDDELFTLGRDRCLAICEELARRRLPVEFECYSKVNGFDDTMAGALKRAGCRMVWFGMESGSDDLLLRMDKQQSALDVTAAVRAAKRAGLAVCCNVLVGYPGETQRSIFKTIELLDHLRPDQVSVQRLRLMPKTDLSNWCEGEGVVDEEAWLLDESDFSYERDFSREGLDVLVRFLGQVTDKAGGLPESELAKYLVLKGHRPVCGCRAVGEPELLDALQAGAASVKALKDRTGAVSGCGTCANIVATWLRVCHDAERAVCDAPR